MTRALLRQIEADYARAIGRPVASPIVRIPAPTIVTAALAPRDDFAAYCQIDAVNWSSLKHMQKSGLHYLANKAAQDKDTAARMTGRTVHTLALEPDRFDQDYAVYEGGDRKGKAWDAFKAANVGKTILKPGELAGSRSAADAVRRHPVARKMLEGCKFEQNVTWTDPETGLLCKMRADFLNPDLCILGDLKTTDSVNPRRFGSQAGKMGYHGQLGGHYVNGCIHGLGWTPKKVAIIAVEAKDPFDVGVFILSEDDIAAGQAEVSRLMLALATCRDTDVWPGQCPDETPLALPGWLFSGNDAEITYDEEVAE